MTASFVAVMPAIDPTYAHACLDTMCDELLAWTLVVDNSHDGDPTLGQRAGFSSRSPGGNIGVAASWNRGLALARAGGYNYCVIISSSIRFGAAGGQDLIDALSNRGAPHGLATQLGWRCIAIGRQCWETIGDFDVEFTPIYFEDTDYLLRLARAGLPSPRENGGTWPTEVIDATCAREAHSLQDGFVSVDYGAQEAKYVQKWGGTQGHETFAHPYDDPRLTYRRTGGPPL